MNLKIKNLSNIGGIVKAPPSKSYSHRAVILASLAEGNSKIYNMLFSEDTLSSINVCKALGATIFQKEDYLEIIGTGVNLHNSSYLPIDLGNSGTTLRLMTSIASLSDNEVILTGDDSLKRRPMGILIKSLENLGINAYSLNDNDKAPIVIKPGFIGGETTILGSVSSQFISSILISSPLSENGVDLVVLPEFKSKSYVDMTIDIMAKFGVVVDNNSYIKHDDCNKGVKACEVSHFKLNPQKYIATDYIVEGDYSSASYLLSAIAILGGNAKILNLFKDSKQGDKLILNILKDFGADIIINEDSVEISSDGNLNGIEVDLSNAPDLLITVAMLGALANGTTKITGVKHARVKETDRIATTCLELKKLGCDVCELEDGMIIGGGISSGVVDSHMDHRLAMGFSLVGLKHNITITNGEVFNVSFPGFIESMGNIGVDLCLE